MKKDRSHWTVRKVSFAEAEALDDEYYASLSPVERLKLLMELRSMIDGGNSQMEPVVKQYKLGEEHKCST